MVDRRQADMANARLISPIVLPTADHAYEVPRGALAQGTQFDSTALAFGRRRT